MILACIAFIAVFSLIVLVHEFGHFVAARKSGISVYEFSIGFPFSPRLFTLFRHKETDFTVRLLPLGGFVCFSKEGDEEARELFEAPRHKRAVVFSAGAIFNLVFGFLVFIPVFSIAKNLPLMDAIWLSMQTIWNMCSGIILLFLNLFTGHGSLQGLSGPVGIAAMAGQAASQGLLNLSYFAGMLSVSLGIMNLLPFPALDGGQLVMLLIETIKRKPLSPRTYQVVTLAGLVVFLVLTVVITYKDVVKLIA